MCLFSVTHLPNNGISEKPTKPENKRYVTYQLETCSESPDLQTRMNSAKPWLTFNGNIFHILTVYNIRTWEQWLKLGKECGYGKYK